MFNNKYRAKLNSKPQVTSGKTPSFRPQGPPPGSYPLSTDTIPLTLRLIPNNFF
jgi:hypothetical protein